MSKEPQEPVQKKTRTVTAKKPAEPKASADQVIKETARTKPQTARTSPASSPRPQSPKAKKPASVEKKSISKSATTPHPAAAIMADAVPTPPPAQQPSQEAINQMISEAAYYRAEKRNFAPGYEEQDWREAKVEILTQLARIRSNSR